MVTVVESEAEWLNGDPDVVSAVGEVLAYTRREARKEAWAVLTRTGYSRTGRDTAFEERVHAMKLTVPWLAESAGYDLVDGQHDLDAAIGVLEGRICNPDRSHGGRWLTSVTEGTFGLTGLTVSIEDAASALDMAADNVITCTLTWTVTERVPREPYV